MSRPQVAPFYDCIGELVQEGVRRVVVDFGQVKWFGAAMLGVLVASLKTIREAGGDLRLTGASEKIVQVLRVTGLSIVLQTSDSGCQVVRHHRPQEPDLHFRAKAPETQRPGWVVPSGAVQRVDPGPAATDQTVAPDPTSPFLRGPPVRCWDTRSWIAAPRRSW